MKKTKLLFVVALSIFCIGLQSCSADEVEIKETENTNINGTKT